MLATDLSFARFTPTAGTRRALALARAVATRSVGAPRLLVLHGPPGVGKTHILRAVLRHTVREERPAPVARATAAAIVEHLVANVKQGPPEVRSLGWEGADVIALDDLHTLAGRPVTQREIARLLCDAVAAGARVLCAAGDPVSTLGPLVAFLRKSPGFAMASLEAPDDREVRRILVELAHREPVRPGRRALTALAASARGDVRRAIGALTSYGFRAGRPPIR